MDQQLSSHDAAIWWTARINDLMDLESLHQVEVVPTTFAPHLGADERVVGASPVTQFDFIPAGDGSYLHQRGGGGFIISSRPGVLAAGAGFALAGAAVRGMGNARRRREAEQLAQPQWRQIDAGILYVSQHGFYLHTPHGLFPWGWSNISAAELVGPGQLLVNGVSDRGPVHWVLQSDCAELAFTFWARARHPDHPQFRSGGWVPPGWVQRAQTSAHGVPQLSSGRWSHVLPPPQR